MSGQLGVETQELASVYSQLCQSTIMVAFISHSLRCLKLGM